MSLASGVLCLISSLFRSYALMLLCSYALMLLCSYALMLLR